jgi:O-methyltransferase
MSTGTRPTPQPPEEHTLLEKVGLIPHYFQQKQGTPWDTAPRWLDLRDPGLYLRGSRLHRRLLREGYTMTSARRGRALFRLAAQLDREQVQGSFVDCGVWNGGSSILLSAAAPGRDIWTYDSFEGLPEAGPLDGAESVGWTGEFKGAEEKLREGFRSYANYERLHVVPGWFDETFPRTADEPGPIALLHADGDWYDSVKLTLETFYPRIVSGGYVVIDDYGHWIGAQRATDELRAEAGDHTPMVAVDYSGRYWRKP